MIARLYSVQALSPLHCGTGQAVGGIDLPIARETPTGIPVVPGSSVKGVLRALPSEDEAKKVAVFGPDTENASDHAGSVQFGDARLIALPVRSVRGVFAWATSPFIVRRLQRDAREAGLDPGPSCPEPPDDGASVTGDSLVADGRVVFEDLDLPTTNEGAWSERARWLAERLLPAEEHDSFVCRACLVPDDIMGHLVETGMEITTRVKLEADTKTTQRGALWTEEALPGESLLAGTVLATPVAARGKPLPEAGELLDHVASLVRDRLVQLGGKATVGRGLCRLRMEA